LREKARGGGRGRSRLPAEQGTRCGAQSQDPEIMTWVEGRRLTNWATWVSLTFQILMGQSVNTKLEKNLQFSLVKVPICQVPTETQQIKSKFLWWHYLVPLYVLQNKNSSPSFFMLSTLAWLNGSCRQQERSSRYHCTCLTICSKEIFITKNHQSIKRKDMIQTENELKNRCLNSVGMGEVLLSSCKMGDLNGTLKA